MNEKTKLFRNFLFLSLFSYLLFLISCNEDLEEIDGTHFGVKPKFKIEIEHAEFVYSKNKNLDKMVNYTKFQNKNKKLNSPVYNFEINEHLVQVIDHEDYTTYTFQIIRANPTENKVENYMVKMNENNVIAHYLVSYPFQIINNKKVINYNATTFISLENPEWMPQNKSASCPPGEVQILENVESFSVPVIVKCTGGGHQPNDPNCNCGTTDPNCSPGYISMSTTTILTWSCGASGGSGGNVISNNGGNNPNNNQTIVVPFIDIERKTEDECKRIKNFLNDNPVFRDSIIAMAQTAASATSERAITLQSNGTQTTINGVNGKVEVPQTPTSNYNAMFHIHNGSNTYSIYSAGDLVWTARVKLVNKKINTRSFISFLATGKGTYYAFTITNTNKFDEFFKYMNWLDPAITPEQRMEYLQIAEIKDEFWKKYYRAEPIKIKEDSPASNKELELEHFINLLVEGDFGISVFESNSNFSDFSPLQKNPVNGATPNIIRKQCQN